MPLAAANGHKIGKHEFTYIQIFPPKNNTTTIYGLFILCFVVFRIIGNDLKKFRDDMQHIFIVLILQKHFSIRRLGCFLLLLFIDICCTTEIGSLSFNGSSLCGKIKWKRKRACYLSINRNRKRKFPCIFNIDRIREFMIHIIYKVICVMIA